MQEQTSDIVLIGGGIMSATLGVLLKELDPNLTITVFEKQDAVATESSNEWNNAGTGHAALCELNYTAEKADGSIETNRAVAINEKFQLSLQLWAYLTEKGYIQTPKAFIHSVPHISFVRGEADVAFLQKRFEALSKLPLFQGMRFTQDKAELAQWMPLMMQNRQENEPLAATYLANGTDVNFGELTRKLFNHLQSQQVKIHLLHSVTDLKRVGENWKITVSHQGKTTEHTAKFVFIGCGGGSLHLLQKSEIPERKHIGGFPVSGQFLVCNNPDIVAQHKAKVYGKAELGAPPMSVPHLDTRFIEGKKSLLFGPFAGFTMKFLKEGSMGDLPSSINSHNLLTMMMAGAKNMALTHYLIRQSFLSKEERMAELRKFIPNAQSEDWQLHVAGQRVQIIKDTENEKGVLCFGTEVIHAEDGSLACLLGASPGASTAVDTMIEVIQKCFKDKLPEWENRLQEILPSYGKLLRNEPTLLAEIQQNTQKWLEL